MTVLGPVYSEHPCCRQIHPRHVNLILTMSGTTAVICNGFDGGSALGSVTAAAGSVEADKNKHAVTAMEELISRWRAGLDLGCPECGPGSGCDHVEGYNYALDNLEQTLRSIE